MLRHFPRLAGRVASGYRVRMQQAVAQINVLKVDRTLADQRATPTALADLATTLPEVHAFVSGVAALTRPSAIHLCTGSQAEYDALIALCVSNGTAAHLNQSKRPGSVIAWTDPADVARAEKDTFICTPEKKDAGPTNNWKSPQAMRAELEGLFPGCMAGRTMYVMPFSMGPIGSSFSKFGVQVTDSAFVVCNMRIMTRMGSTVLNSMTPSSPFVQCVHSVGQPIPADAPANSPARTASWPCNIPKRRIVHFMDGDKSEVWSFGSGYGGNSLLGKKCFSLRVASVMARDQGWLAEHMLILGITNPQGVKRYIAAAFPSACGKTNLAMMEPSLPGWKVEVVGDDIAWMRIGADGRLYAVNPEFGFFGVAPGTSMNSNPNAMRTISKNTIFTNVAMTEDGDVWWEGMTKQPPAGNITDWKKQARWTPGDKDKPAAHANSRFTTPLSQCPVLDPNWDNPNGVPIDAIVFGGRRSDTMPLVFESFNWQHGTFLGAAMRSQATAAADQEGLVFDPMAMKPFIGYNVKDYWQHWLDLDRPGVKLPKVFHVNWFLKGEDGKFLWPGFGENSRVLKWMLDRVDGKAASVVSPIGHLPAAEALDLRGIKDFKPENLERVLAVDPQKWQTELQALKQQFHHKLMQEDATPVPAGILTELEALEQRLAKHS